jgi:capsular polysaccharide transport system permease protein
MTLHSHAAAEEALVASPAPHLPAKASSATVTSLFLPARPTGATLRPPHRRVSLRAMSFLVAVVLPVAVAAAYYLAIAADQYVAEFRMNLRTVDAPRIEPLLLFAGDAARGAATTESQIVTQFIASRAIIDELDPKLDLRRLFSSPEADWWARLWLPASIEQLVYYWQNQVDPFYDTSTGTIIVRARAFAPDDALRLAQAIVACSERLINDLSVRARHDALGYAEAEVATAETRLKTALAAIREFRDREGMIDPGKTAEANATLATKLRDDLLKANSELATLKTYMRDDAPPVRVLKARIRSLDTQLRTLAREMTASAAPQTTGLPAAPALSLELGSYETLDAERKFAEAAYQHALEALDRARDNADRQHIYIESFVPPSLPQTSLYPRRWRSLGTVALIAFAIWAIGGLSVQSIRDHL